MKMCFVRALHIDGRVLPFSYVSQQLRYMRDDLHSCYCF